MKTGDNGISLIKRYEGLRLKAYKCAAGVWTIGYGHTGPDVKEGMSITEDKAVKLLCADLKLAENAVIRVLPDSSQNQFDALVSFTFNVGSGNFLSSTLLKKAKVNAEDESIRNEFARWNHACVNGVLTVLPGLTRRRKDEADLYFL